MVDRDAAAAAIEAFLRALGHEPTGDLEGTPERVADAWAELPEAQVPFEAVTT